jgi:hypothetical protein
MSEVCEKPLFFEFEGDEGIGTKIASLNSSGQNCLAKVAIDGVRDVIPFSFKLLIIEAASVL